ncbi:MAG: winged helix-turn-helix transcriptional regulator [Candidatus Micrarchaeota archaeon]
MSVKDRRILRALSGNARQSLSSVGRAAGLSEELVNYRLRNLIEKGVIQHFRAEIDFSKLGYRDFRLYIKLQGASARKENEIFNYLKNSRGATWLAVCEGEYNFVFRFVVKDEFELNDFLNALYARFSRYIRDRRVIISVGWQFYPGESGVYEIGARRYEKPKRSKPVEVDDIDMRLLEMLAEDARAPSARLAGELGLTPNAVRYRMKRLESEGVIKGYQMVADRSKIGMYHYKVLLLFQRASEEKIEKFVRFCESLPNLVFLVQLIGAWDMDVDFDFRNAEELHGAMLELGSRFGDLIRNYETLSVVKSTYCNPLKIERKS